MTNKMENINDVIMERNYTVYMHVSPNGKRYIGITRRKVNVRWQNGKGYKRNEYFWRAIQKYEWDNFEHIIIENNLTKEQAENMEIELIAKYRSNDREYGYNIESGGNAIGRTSDETRKKISDANKGKKHSIETIKKLSELQIDRYNKFAKKIFCDKLIFKNVKECANYYSINKDTMEKWLQSKRIMNSDFQKLNLRYATENDLNECETYDSKKHGNKSNVNIKVIYNGEKKIIHCNGIIFNSIKECANYYGINNCTMS